MRRQLRFSIWFPIVLVAAFAAGYLFWLKRQVPGPYDLEPMTVVRNRNASVDTSNWKTYRNEEYGFEIKYPKNWQDINGNGTGGEILDIAYKKDMAVCAEGVGCSYPGEIFMRGITKKDILVPYGTIPPAVFANFAEKYNAAGLNNLGRVNSPVIIDGHEAIKIDAPDNLIGVDKVLVPDITFLVNYSSDSVVWFEVRYFPENKNYVSNIFSQILSMFKFTRTP